MKPSLLVLLFTFFAREFFFLSGVFFLFAFVGRFFFPTGNLYIFLAIYSVIHIILSLKKTYNDVSYYVDGLDSGRGRFFIFSPISSKKKVWGRQSDFLKAGKDFSDWFSGNLRMIVWSSLVKKRFYKFVPVVFFVLLPVYYSYSEYNPTSEVFPKDTTVVERSFIEIKIKLDENLPRAVFSDVTLLIDSKPGGIRQVTEDIRYISYYVGNITESFTYQFSFVFNSVKFYSNKYMVNVVRHPSMKSATITVVPPSYTRSKEFTVNWEAKNYNINQYSVVKIDIAFDSLVTGSFYDDADNLFSHEIDGKRIEYSTRPISQNISLKMAASTFSGLFLQDSIGPSFTMIRDNPPLIRLIEPDSVFQMPLDEMVSFRVFYADDFGLENIIFNYRTSGQHAIGADTLSGLPNQTGVAVLNKDFSQFYMFPGDTVFYTITAYDERGQFKSAQVKIGEFVVYYPSMVQLFSKLESRENANSALSQIDRMRSSSEIERLRYRIETSRSQVSSFEESAMAVLERESQNLENLISFVDEVKRDMAALKNQISDRSLKETLDRIEELMNDSLVSDFLNKINEKLESKGVDENIAEFLKEYEFKLDRELDRLERSLKALENVRKELQKALLDSRLEDIYKQLGKMAEQLTQENANIDSQLKTKSEEISDIKDKYNQKGQKDTEQLSSASKSLQSASDKNKSELAKAGDIAEAMSSIGSFLQQRQQSKSAAGSPLQIEKGLWMYPAKVSELMNNYIYSREHVKFSSVLREYGMFINRMEELDVKSPGIFSVVEDLHMQVQGFFEYFRIQDNKSFEMAFFRSYDIMALTNIMAYRLLMLEMQAQGSCQGGGSGKSAEDILAEMGSLSVKQSIINTLSYNLLRQIAQSGTTRGYERQVEQMLSQQRDVINSLRDLGEHIQGTGMQAAYDKLMAQASEIEERLDEIRTGDRIVADLQKDFLENLRETVSGFRPKEEVSPEREAITATQQHDIFYGTGLQGSQYWLPIYENHLDFLLRYGARVNQELYNRFIESKIPVIAR